MPKQIIADVFGEILETGKKTAKQLTQLPGEMVEEAAQQTGVKPTVEEQKQEDAQIQKLKTEDEQKKKVEIAKLRKQLFPKQSVAFAKPPPSSSPADVGPKQGKKQELAVLEEEKKKELPQPVMAVKRKQAHVEMKGRVSG